MKRLVLILECIGAFAILTGCSFLAPDDEVVAYGNGGPITRGEVKAQEQEVNQQARSGLDNAKKVDFSAAIQGSDRLIVPGERIGPIQLGMSRAEVLALLGNPEKITKYIDGYSFIYLYDQNKIHVGFSTGSSPTVIEITTWDQQFSTAEGVHIGDSEAELIQRLGSPSSSGGRWRFYQYGNRRMTVEVGPNTLVGVIHVWWQ